jgi:hypothetical protein
MRGGSERRGIGPVQPGRDGPARPNAFGLFSQLDFSLALTKKKKNIYLILEFLENVNNTL